MPSNPDLFRKTASEALFEKLEDRFLLTTIQGGEFFLYHNSQGETVRLSLSGTGAVEVFAHHVGWDRTDPQTGVLYDLPGVYGADALALQNIQNTYSATAAQQATLEQRWEDAPSDPLVSTLILRPANPFDTRPFDQQSFTVIPATGANDPMWLEYGDYYPLVQNPGLVAGGNVAGGQYAGNALIRSDWAQVTRGSRAEIFSIVVLTADETTSLTVTTLSGAPFLGNTNIDWTYNINTWNSTLLPLLTASQARAPIVDNPVTPPAGSGGVIIGAFNAPSDMNFPEYPRYVGVSEQVTMEDVPRTGLFAGGDVLAGITISNAIYRIASQNSMGTNVLAVAADWNSIPFAVDSSAFHGTEVNDTTAGNLGGGINALAADSFGQFFTVDDGRSPGFIGTDPNGLAGNVNSVAYDDANDVFYTIDESNQHLIRTDLTGATTDLGAVVDSSVNDNSWHYRNVVAMDFNEATGELWAVATVLDILPGNGTDPDPAGPFLIVIQPIPSGGFVRAQQMGLLTPPPDNSANPPWTPAAQAPTLQSIAWSPDNSTLYGVTTSSNQLVVIETSTGTPGRYYPAGWAGGDRSEIRYAGLNMPQIVGMDFIGNTLYFITGAGSLYYLDDLSDTDSTILLGPTGVSSLASLTAGEDPRQLYTIARDATGLNRLTSISIYSSLKSVDPVTGVATPVASLWDGTEPTFAYTDVTALEYRTDAAGNEALYGVATIVDLDPNAAPNAPAGRWLVLIDTFTDPLLITQAGRVTALQALVGPSDLSSMTWDAINDVFIGVDPADGELWTLAPTAPNDPTAPWTETDLTFATSVPGITGLEWVDMGTVANPSPIVFGVDATSLYSIDLASGTCSPLGDTGETGMTALTFDATQGGMLWAVDSELPGDYRLVALPLSARLESMSAAGAVVPRGLLFEDPLAVGYDPLHVYTNVTAMDFTSRSYITPTGLDDRLVAVAELASLDPLNDPVAGNSWLITIDKATGLVTPLWQLNVPTLSTIAFDAQDNLYGYEPVGRDLCTVNLATQTVENFLDSGPAIVGMDFVGDILYGASSSALYTIDVVTGAAMSVPEGALAVGVTGLASDPNDTAGKLWASWESDGEYFLLSVFTDTTKARQDIGKIVVAGTVAGMITNAGNMDMTEVGFLWGGITSNANINTVLMRQGGGGVPLGIGYAYQRTGANGDSVISADGVVNFVDSRGGATLYTGVEARNMSTVGLAPWASAAVTQQVELETIVPAQYFASYWLQGYLVDYINDSMANAQMLNLGSGQVIHVDGDIPRGQPTSLLPDGQNLPADWYGLPMMAGETVSVIGEANMPMGMVPLLLHYPRGTADIRLNVYDSGGHLMDTLGWESLEDWGVGSRPGPDGTPKPITFTAPSADIYYFTIVHNDPGWDAVYWFEITGATPKAIGGINVEGTYRSLNTVANTQLLDVVARNKGHVGAMVVSGNTWGLWVGTLGGGDVYVLQGGELGSMGAGGLVLDKVASEGNIGRIASTVSWVAGYWEAGLAPTLVGQIRNNDAHIQIMSAKTDMVQVAAGICYISATGSIGVLEAGGNFEGLSVTVNSDSAAGLSSGPAGHLDLIDVGGDWGTGASAPLLKRGPKGDIGFVHVAGDIYINVGPPGAMHTLLLQETTLTRGQSATLNDDGGGQVVVSPVASPVLDASGNVVINATTGQPQMFLPSISYAYIGVDDDLYAGSGDGGVIANLRINGSASMKGTGAVQISNLDLNYNAADLTWRTVTITGTGAVDIYDVQSTGPIDAITNNTAGRLVGGSIGGLGQLNLQHGGLGWYVSTNTKQWVHALMNAPVSANTDAEPQYGWYHGKVNGLDIEGSLGMVSVGGDMGDLRVTGTLGTVIVNADHTRGINDWDGVKGLVWAGSRIESIEVGNGLADDGPSDVAKAGIMSGGSIGTVTIAGPRRVINGVVYGELNGSILGAADTQFTVTNLDGSTTTYLQDSVGQVLGTNGAQLTAIVGGLTLTAFQASMTTAPLPGGAVGYVKFDGLGSMIHGAEIDGTFVREVVVSAAKTQDSLGMVDTFITGMRTPANGLGVGRVAAGGPGMNNVNVHSDGGNIGILEGLGPIADMLACNFVSSDGINTIKARDMDATGIHAPGLVGTVTMTRDLTNAWALDPVTMQIVPGELVGAFGTVTIGRDYYANWVVVAGVVSKMVIGGEFDESILRLSGAAANLKIFDVAGDIGGDYLDDGIIFFPPEITSAGQIGTITSRNGGIYADISTTLESGATNGDIGSISTAQGFFGNLLVTGSLGSFLCRSDLGDNPALFADESDLQIFNIGGNLGLLKVSGTAGNPSNLYADFNIAGNIGTIDVDGDYYAQIFALGDVGTVKVAGLFGGDPSIGVPGPILNPGNRGSLDALGDIGTMSLARVGDLTANITAGGNIQNISVKNGSILGNITSRHGDIMGLTVTNGSITGNVSGWNVRSIVVTNGNVSGDVLATNGSVQVLKVTGKKGDPSVGNLLGNVIANNGRIETLAVTTGNIGTPAKELTVSATGGIKSIKVTGGNLYSNVETGGVLDALNVGGTMNDLTVAADGGIKSLTTTGNVSGVSVRAGTTLDKVSIGGAALNSTFSAGWNIGTFATKGNMTSSRLLAGYDVGQDMATVLIGNGAGVLTPGASVGVGNSPVAAALADLNDDGAMDLVVVDRGSDAVSVLLGNGNGSFGMRRMYNVGALPSALAIGDVNDDGVLDVVVANEADDTVSILLGRPDGTLQDQTTLAVGDAPVAVILTDLDGDGELDLVTADSGAGGVSVSLKDGAGTLQAAVAYATGGTPTALAVGDFDGANGLDIAVADGANDNVTLLMNDGTGVFVAGTVAATGDNPVSLAAADLDGDGSLDLVAANEDSDNISILLGDGAGALAAQAPIVLDAGSEPVAIVAARMTGAGTDVDLVALNEGSRQALVLLGVGDGTFLAAPAAGVAEGSLALALGDVDADGAPDVIVVGQGGGQNPFNGGDAHSGNIASVTIGGTIDGSVVAAGMAPGADGLYNVLGANTAARGYSAITKMTVKGFANSAGASTVVADSAIDAKFLTVARAVGAALIQVPLNVPGAFTPAVVEAPGDFGPGMAATPKTLTITSGGIIFNLTGAGLASYNALTGTLTLKGTTSASNLTITYKGAAPWPVVDIIGSGGDDESLGSLKTVGNVALGDINLDGPIKSIATTLTEADALWDLPGGVGTVSLVNAPGLNVTAGAIGTWTMKGAMATGTVVADSLGAFTTVGDSAADITTGLGGLKSLSVKGRYSGQIQTFLSVGTLATTGVFDGVVVSERGDITSVKSGLDFLGRIEAVRGAVGSVTVSAGDFGVDPLIGLGNPTLETAVRSSNGIGAFTITNGDFFGLVSTDGAIKTVSVAKGDMAGRLRAGGAITSATFLSMTYGLATAGSDFTTIKINGDMYGSSIYSGFDPGDAGYSPDPAVRDANAQIDFFTPGGYRTTANADRALGGDITSFYVKGDVGATEAEFAYAPCTISAAVDPGSDGFCGTSDDVAYGTGYIKKATVDGGIYGDSVAGTTYGFFAASKTPTVTAWKGDAFGGNENVLVASIPAAVGALEVISVAVADNAIIVTFNHAINFSTITPQTFELLMSTNQVFGDADDVNVAVDLPSTFTYDVTNHSVTLTLDGSATWNNLTMGNYFQLTLDGSRVSDVRSSMLDGEYTGTFPSGNRRPGGDFVYQYDYGQQWLDTTPAYVSLHGTAPTAVGMLAGYYDRMPEFQDIIAGGSAAQSNNVNNIIASQGDGDGTLVDPGTPGSGHVADYAFYDGVDDSFGGIYLDLSDPGVIRSTGVTPHVSNSIADFLQTSFSLAGNVFGQTQVADIVPGVEGFFGWVNGGTYQADATLYDGAAFTWQIYIQEINAKRPVLIGMDMTGSGTYEQEVIGIGYDMASQLFAYINPVDGSTGWTDFTPGPFSTVTVVHGVTVTVLLA